MSANNKHDEPSLSISADALVSYLLYALPEVEHLDNRSASLLAEAIQILNQRISELKRTDASTSAERKG